MFHFSLYNMAIGNFNYICDLYYNYIRQYCSKQSRLCYLSHFLSCYFFTIFDHSEFLALL